MPEEKKPETEKKEEKVVEKLEEKKEEIKEPIIKKEKSKEEPREEREFIIPLRRKSRVVPRYKRTSKAVKFVKEFLMRHMKVYDRDYNKIKLDKSLNEFLWRRGIKNPPFKVRVKAFREGEIIRAELAELPEKFRFKKEKLERREKKAAAMEPKKTLAPAPAVKEKTEEEKAEEKEKKAAVIESGKKMEKAAAKQAKHTAKDKKSQPKRQQRMALAK